MQSQQVDEHLRHGDDAERGDDAEQGIAAIEPEQRHPGCNQQDDLRHLCHAGDDRGGVGGGDRLIGEGSGKVA